MKHTILFIVLFLTGCVGVTQNGLLTVDIPTSVISSTIAQQFPLSKSTNYGDIKISNPDLLVGTDDKASLGGEFSFKNRLLSPINATFKLSGNIEFNSEKRAFFIQNAIVNKMSINNNSLLKSFNNVDFIEPILINLISQIPVYTMPQKYKYVKNAVIKDGNIKLFLGI